MPAYYNEIEPYAAAWLRNLIVAGHIAPGDVDERDIRDVQPAELRDYDQCHFFAGIGGWSLALRMAGWPDDRPVWTGSCPCQPFSAAGRGGGFADERHLWPAFHHLIAQCGPPVAFGEQVASKDGLAWLDLVSADLEGTGYAFAAVDMGAAGIGAPHIRQRLWWVAVASVQGSQGGQPAGQRSDAQREAAERGGEAGGLDDAASPRHFGALERAEGNPRNETRLRLSGAGRGPGGLEHAARDGWEQRRPGPTNGFWRDPDWLRCRDGKWRPVEPGTFPLAHGVSNRVGQLRAFGNAIVPQVAAEFIAAYLDTTEHLRLIAEFG